MATSPIPGTNPAAGATGASASLTENFETFLTLLTEQMKNQDPLNPMDSTQFVSQLVEFSGVEQQINQNKNLETLIGLQLAGSRANAASYIGKEVTVATQKAELAGGEAKWSYTLPQDAAKAKLLVENAAGKLVYVADAETKAGSHEFAWDGKDATGVQLPDGVYKLSIAAQDEAEETIAASVTTSGRVTAADFSGQEPAVLIGAVRAGVADIRSLRESAADGA